ncbi:MAG: thioredoxin family protein [Candidatus Riflebacteria bacterium]|nr:thioredoxin family protein [Candidatus Riflebacteria bacterium]
MLTVETFEKTVIEEKKPTALCFTASWCLPSQTQIKDIEELRGKYEDKFLIEVHDVEQSSDLAKMLKVNNFPTTLFFAEGELKEQNCLYGYQDATMLTDSFECTLWEMENKSTASKYVWWIIGALALVAIILSVYTNFAH